MGEESPSCRYSRKCISDLGNHTLKLLEWNPSHACFTQADPSAEDREEVGLFCLFQTNGFVNSVKIKTKYGLCSSIFPIALLELLLRDGVIGIVVVSGKKSWIPIIVSVLICWSCSQEVGMTRLTKSST